MNRFHAKTGMHPRYRSLFVAATLAAALFAGGCRPCDDVLTYETNQGKTYIYNCGQLLAVYNHAGNTFTDFWVEGVNLIGGFCGGAPGSASNSGGATKGHSAEYPFGHRDANGNMLQWQGFWSGFNYMDKRWMLWSGVPGNPLAQCSSTIDQPRDDLVVLHVVTQVPFCFDPFYQCEVDYFISPKGIGVRNVITVYKELQPLGYDDTGGQFLMTQVECDLDPGQLYFEISQPDLYYKLALNDSVVSISPFPPYNTITPSNIYADGASSSQGVYPLPNTALVSSTDGLAFIGPLARPSRNLNLALRIDIVNSTLPPLEYYCEYNGERDYLNFLFSPAIGVNRTDKVVAAGTQWILRGDLVPWTGTNPSVVRNIPWLYE
ncbi:MAG TPA: hypothetical protein VLM89_11480 [Phycisphaerae bacterium]|nr:hypothetical protein [Phycisphaerae bacterium]